MNFINESENSPSLHCDSIYVHRLSSQFFSNVPYIMESFEAIEVTNDICTE